MKNRLHERENVIQQTRGYESIAYVKGKITYGRCVTKHIDLIRAELMHLMIEIDATIMINALEKIFKEHEIKLKAE